ncbi:MAG: alkaline phosphatase family protein, partial [Gaiellaceae bacterium]
GLCWARPQEMKMISRYFKAFATGVLATVTFALASMATAAGPADATETTTPIKHFVVLMQENHTFDNYFGTYPGADGIPEGTCMPRNPNKPKSKCVEPFPIGGRAVVDLEHRSLTHEAQFNGGAMDGFVWALRSAGEDAETTMGYYDDKDIPYYWNIADEFVLFDRFFSSASGGSIENHMYWLTGAPGRKANEPSAIPDEGWGDIPTIFDRLEAAGISWKFYIQNYNPRITIATPEVGDRGAQIVWVPLLAYPRYINNDKLFDKIVDLPEYFEDLANDTLPSVAFIVPSGASEHPPGSIQAGERFVRSLITGLMTSDSWESSAFMWTYDDWGGWYDHVKPPKVDKFGYGFRVPALMVSPYARRGHIDSTTLDFTSPLKFIQENWGVDSLHRRDREANNFLSAFDFTKPPREPILLGSDRGEEIAFQPKRHLIYTFYGLAIGIPFLIVTGAFVSRRRDSKQTRELLDGRAKDTE